MTRFRGIDETMMEEEGLTGLIIGAAMKVRNTLGAGFLESVYEKAITIELRKAGLQVETQVPIRVL